MYFAVKQKLYFLCFNLCQRLGSMLLQHYGTGNQTTLDDVHFKIYRK